MSLLGRLAAAQVRALFEEPEPDPLPIRVVKTGWAAFERTCEASELVNEVLPPAPGQQE